MKWAIAGLWAVGACYLGMVIFVVAMVLGGEDVAAYGAWLTLPLTLLYAVPLTLLLITAPVAAAMQLAERWRGRKRR